MMFKRPLSPLLFLVLLCPALTTTTAQDRCTSTVPHVRAAFWSSHSNYYSAFTRINTSLFTHVYYSSLSLDTSTMQVTLTSPGELPIFASFSSMLKNQNATLKTLISISSIDQGTNLSMAFSSLVANSANRVAFIESSIQLARENSFDGLNLAWQFPASTTDMVNLALLLAEWRARVNRESNDTRKPPLLLTASVYFSGHLFDAPSDNIDYPVPSISDNLDWVNALTFGFHSDGNVTASDAALYDITSHFSTNYGINSWLDAGLSPCKLVMGIPLYGRSWFLKNKEKFKFGAEVVAKGPKQKLSNQTGIMAYFEIERFLSNPGAEFIYNSRMVSANFHIQNLWVSFDSADVVRKKLAYVKKNGLLGYFLWPLNFDTPNGATSQLAADLWRVDLAPGDREVKNSGTEQLHFPPGLPPRYPASDTSASDTIPTRGVSAVPILQLQCFALLVYHIFCLLKF